MTLLHTFLAQERELEQLRNDLERITEAVQMAQSTQASVSQLTEPQAQYDAMMLGSGLIARQLGLESAESLFGTFSLDTINVSMESISSLPGKVWRAIADLIDSLIKKAKALYRSIMDKLFNTSAKVSDGLDSLEARIEANEKTIEALNLEPGYKLKQEDIDRIAETESVIILDPQGRVLNKAMIESDLSVLIPTEYRGGPEILRALVMDGSWNDMASSIQTALDWSTKLLSTIDRAPYAHLVDALMSVNKEEDIKEILEKLVPGINDLEKEFINALPLRGKDFKSARAVMGDVYPTFMTERSGKVHLSTLVYSYTEQRQTMQPTKKLPRGLPKLTMAEMQNVRGLIAKLETVRTQYSNALSGHLEQLERLNVNNHRALASTVSNILELETEHNMKDVEAIQNMVRSIPKMHRMAVSYLESTERYLRTLIASLNAYLILIAGKD